MPPGARNRSSKSLAVLALLLIAGGAVAIFYYSRQENRPTAISELGFNVTSLPNEPNSKNIPQTNTVSSDNAAQSGLNMIHTGMPGLFGNNKKSSPVQNLAQAFTALCRANESKVQALAMAYTRQYPVIRQYGRDWMKYPDLKKLNDDYMRDHDPVKFLRGVAASQNFGLLAKQYAGHPEIQAFAQDAMKQAPPQLLSTGISYLSKDGIVKGVASQVAGALGFPPSIFNALNGNSPQIDQKAIMNSVNSQIQKALPQIQSGNQNQ